jgi:putative DNA primase/helicase
LAGLFLNMNRYSNGSDREFWLQAWNGGAYVVERQGRPPVELDHLLVGVTGGFRPDKLVKSFSGDDDGMYARVLLGWPEQSTYEPLSNDADEIDPEFQNALTRLADLPSEDDDGKFVPKPVWLSDDAIREFEQFRQSADRLRATHDGRDREWMAKGEGQVLRLAGTLHYLSWAMLGGPEPERIDLQFMQAAVSMWRDYFLLHSRAALRLIGHNDRHVDTRRVLRWLQATNRQEISREDIRRDALGQRLDADGTQKLIDSLVVRGWLREVTARGEGPGRPARRWAVNPSLFQ